MPVMAELSDGMDSMLHTQEAKSRCDTARLSLSVLLNIFL